MRQLKQREGGDLVVETNRITGWLLDSLVTEYNFKGIQHTLYHITSVIERFSDCSI